MLCVNSHLARRLIFVLLYVVCVTSVSYAEEQQTRWDRMMIQEATTWQPMLLPYLNGIYAWPAPKAGAERILREYPKSRWSNDARLILAGGTALTEGGLSESLGMLGSIDANVAVDTIVVGWRPRAGCSLDRVWLMNAGSLVFLNEDGTVRTTKPFDKDGPIPQEQQEVLAYFGHLDKHPRSASTVSSLMRAQMLFAAKQDDKAIEVLDKMVTSARANVADVAAADRKAADAADGYHLRRLWRPEYEAWNMLAQAKARKDPKQASDLMLELAKLISPKGECSRVNEIAGDYAVKAGREPTAREQFELAANGLTKDIALDQKREDKITRSPLPPGAERTPTDLERNLQEVLEKKSKS